MSSSASSAPPAQPYAASDSVLASSPLNVADRVRYIGVDLARLVAIVGMMAAHLITLVAHAPGTSAVEQNIAAIADVITAGTAASLFAVLGGVSMALASQRLLAAGRRGAAVGGICVRGAFLVVIGLALAHAGGAPIIVLAYYGVAMILVSTAVLAPAWVVATVAGALALGVGPLNTAVRTSLMVVNEGGSITFTSFWQQPIEALRALVLTGSYPALTWATYMLIGILVARTLVRAAQEGILRLRAYTLAGIGLVVAGITQAVSEWMIAHVGEFVVGGFMPEDPSALVVMLHSSGFGAPTFSQAWGLLIATPHTGTLFDILRTAGIAMVVIGVFVAIFDGGTRTRRPGRLLDTLRSAGAAPLTTYSFHILATAALLNPTIAVLDQGEAASIPWYAAGISAFFLQLAGVVLIGFVLSLLKRRGPLEAVLSGTVKLATQQRVR